MINYRDKKSINRIADRYSRDLLLIGGTLIKPSEVQGMEKIDNYIIYQTFGTLQPKLVTPAQSRHMKNVKSAVVHAVMEIPREWSFWGTLFFNNRETGESRHELAMLRTVTGTSKEVDAQIGKYLKDLVGAKMFDPDYETDYLSYGYSAVPSNTVEYEGELAQQLLDLLYSRGFGDREIVERYREINSIMSLEPFDS